MHLTSPDRVFQPRCKHFNSCKTCGSSYGVGANVLFILKLFWAIFTLHVCTLNLLRYAPLDFIYPFVLKKFRFAGKFTLEPGHRKLFRPELPCVPPMDEILLSHSPLRAHAWICSSAAPSVPILCTFVGDSPSSALCVGIRFSGTSTRGTFVGDQRSTCWGFLRLLLLGEFCGWRLL